VKKKPTRSRAETKRTLLAAVERARELGIKHLVVASTTGRTALDLAALVKSHFEIVCVTHHAGFREPGKCELTPDTENKLAEQGIWVVRAGHALSGVERAIRAKFGGLGPAETIAWTLRTFGEGTKVCVEIAVMAVDAGLVPHGRDVVAIAGTGAGADTALVVRPTNAKSLFDLKVREVITKPTDWM
jgi:hypothetical protein